MKTYNNLTSQIDEATDSYPVEKAKKMFGNTAVNRLKKGAVVFSNGESELVDLAEFDKVALKDFETEIKKMKGSIQVIK